MSCLYGFSDFAEASERSSFIFINIMAMPIKEKAFKTTEVVTMTTVYPVSFSVLLLSGNAAHHQCEFHVSL